jgi:heme exporter protein D
MVWNSWSAFFDMGGYGLYVWGAVILTFTLIFGEILSLAMRWKSGVKDLGNWLHSEEKDDDENKV